MEAICTATTSSGKKCTRCVEKHGVEFCWQHAGKRSSKVSSKTPKKSPVKKVSPKKSSTRGRSLKTSPKKEAFPLEKLPREVLYDVLMKLPYERLNAACRTSKKLAKICNESRFQQEYKAKHPGHLDRKMFIGELAKPTLYDIRGKPGNYIFHDEIGNKLTIDVNLRDGVNNIEYTPKNQNYGLPPVQGYDPISIFAHKSHSRITGGWAILVQRSDEVTGWAYTGPGYLGEIENFLISIGKERWFSGLKKTAEDIIYMSPRATAEFLTIIKNELDKLWPKKIPKI